MDLTKIENYGSLLNINSIVDDLKCSICLDYFKVPRTLSCQHTFCTECLKPLLKQSTVLCPQCRQFMKVQSVEKIPKNTLIQNILSTLNKSLATCPKCNKLEKLGICDHCNHVFCDNCKLNHYEETVKRLDSKNQNYDDTLKKLQNLENDLLTAEQNSLREVVEKMDNMKLEILSLWQSRKLVLIDEASRFYQKKLKIVQSSIESLKNISKNAKEVSDKLKRFKEKGKILPIQNPIYQTKSSIETLKELENKFNNFDIRLMNAVPKIDLNMSKLDFEYEKLEKLNLYNDIMKKIYFKSTEDDNHLFYEATHSNEINTKKNIVKLKPLFGKPITIEFNKQIEITPERIREKIAEETGFKEKRHEILFFNNKYAELKENELEDLCRKLQLNDRPVPTKRQISITNNDYTNKEANKSICLTNKFKFEPPNNDEINDILIFSIRNLKS